MARVSLRARTEDRGTLAAALGAGLPARVGDRAEGAGGRAALCLGPDEWLLTAPEAGLGALLDALAAVYAEAPHAAIDISDRELTVAVEGPRARELLSIGCPRDLARLEPGRAVRTLFDGVQVVLWRDGPEAFRLDAWRSFMPHVRALLETGRRELATGL
jgi:sarcosine oxidase subunit gamma